MRQVDCVITSEMGLHARPAGLIVKEAGKFKSEITFVCGEKKAQAGKIFALMGLGAKQGDIVSVMIEGADENEAAQAFERLLEEYV